MATWGGEGGGSTSLKYRVVHGQLRDGLLNQGLLSDRRTLSVSFDKFVVAWLEGV